MGFMRAGDGPGLAMGAAHRKHTSSAFHHDDPFGQLKGPEEATPRSS
jgi:hypothetical protein